MISDSNSNFPAQSMGSLTVDIEAPSDLRWSGALPVQVRNVYELGVAATSVSDRGMSVPAGRYLVTALLPNGEVAAVDDIVEIRPGEELRVKLSVPRFELPANLANVTTFGDKVMALARPLTDLFSANTFAIMKGNWLPARIESGAHPTMTREPTTRSSLEVSYPATKSWIEIANKRGCTYVAIPVDENRSTIIQWNVDDKTGDVDVKLDFQDGELNSFFDFIKNDQALGARAIGQSMIDRAEQYMMEKRRSPLLAVLGAYVLLRANELDGMDLWTDNLLKWSTWLPDVLALRIEYLARQGDHARASKLLLDAPNHGVPWFRSGVGYLESRSRIYVSVGGSASKRSSLPLSDNEVAKVGRIAATFGELAAALDMAQWSTVLRRVPRID